MSERDSDQANGKTPPGDPKAAEKARLSAALRANLQRRKAQARGRAAERPKPADE